MKFNEDEYVKMLEEAFFKKVEDVEGLEDFGPVSVKSYFEKFDKAFKTNKVNFPRTFFNDSYEVYGES